MRFTILLLTAVLLTATALAQQKVPPPPKPAPDGPSLEVTMKFIQEKLNGVGKVSWMASLQQDQETTRNLFVSEFSSVIADVVACKISYHIKRLIDEDVNEDSNRWFVLKDVVKLEVISLNDQNNRDNPKGWVYTASPDVFNIVVYGSNAKKTFLTFQDEEFANRIAKALVHAVELCGGGKKDEPF